MSLAPTADRLKKVMRIALVGIRPADQILLKGYLRVLLRLEADLEWVSANSPQVDLFMINEEFSHAESVQRLLASQPHVPTLQIDRNEQDRGGLRGNTLSLPLKEIDVLNQWLFANVTSLRTTGDNRAPFSSANSNGSASSNATDAPRQTFDDLLATRNNANTNPATLTQTLATASTPQSVSNAIATTVTPSTQPQKTLLIDTLKTLQQRQDSIFALKQADKVIAYVNPKHQRVWVLDSTVSLTGEWALSPVSEQPPMVSQTASDLVQWLWQKASTSTLPTTLLVQSHTRYRLTSWLKPLDDDHRHDILKIQGLLESRDSTLDEITQIAQVTRELAMQSVFGLIVSGLMTPAVYASLSAIAPPSTSVTPTAEPLSSPTLAQPTTVSPSSPTAATPLESVSQIPATPTQQSATPDDGMKGFLSKLRRKLGL